MGPTELPTGSRHLFFDGFLLQKNLQNLNFKFKKVLKTAQNGSKFINFGDFLILFRSKLCLKVRIKSAPGRGLYENPDKIGLREPKKSPHKDPFCQNIPLRGLSGVLFRPVFVGLSYFQNRGPNCGFADFKNFGPNAVMYS